VCDTIVGRSHQGTPGRRPDTQTRDSR
jgi:hypothetical protein